MPEGPEVTYLTEFLRKSFVNKKIIAIDVLKGRYVNHGKPNNFDEFVNMLPLKCLRVEKKGKVIFMYFEQDWCIVSKLGMTGWWYDPLNKPTWRNMYPNIVFKTSSNTEVHYGDFRNFGTLTFYKRQVDIDKELCKLAPDILSSTTSFRKVIARIHTFKKTQMNQLIEDAIIDQKLIVSGIGNYLKSEVLYGSRISPLRALESISFEEWKRIFHYMKHITRKMVMALHKNDVDLYMNSMHVYSKKKDKFGHDVKMRTSKTGRVTYWVPEIQK